MEQNNFLFIELPLTDSQQNSTSPKREVKFQVSRIYSLDSQKQDYFYDTETGLYFTLIGYISNFNELKKEFRLNTKSDLQLISLLWKTVENELFSLLKGIFTLVVYNTKMGELIIYHDEFGFNQPLYYTTRDNTFYFSSNLKYLLSMSATERILNPESAMQFLLSGFLYFGNVVPGEETLFNNIKKLLPSQMIYRESHSTPPAVIKKRTRNSKVSGWY
jgi:asparagine synthase (glutamine-hydrolysing)